MTTFPWGGSCSGIPVLKKFPENIFVDIRIAYVSCLTEPYALSYTGLVKLQGPEFYSDKVCTFTKINEVTQDRPQSRSTNLPNKAPKQEKMRNK